MQRIFLFLVSYQHFDEIIWWEPNSHSKKLLTIFESGIFFLISKFQESFMTYKRGVMYMIYRTKLLLIIKESEPSISGHILICFEVMIIFQTKHWTTFLSPTLNCRSFLEHKVNHTTFWTSQFAFMHLLANES